MPRLISILVLFVGLIAAPWEGANSQDDGRYPLFGPEALQFPEGPESDAGFLPPPMGGDIGHPIAPPEVVPSPAPSTPPKDTAAAVDGVVVPATGPLPWWKPWEGSFELGMNGTHGNMDTFNLRIGAKAKRASPQWVHLAEFTHIDKTNNNKTIAYNLLFDGRVERLFVNSPWSVYWHGLTEYDEFKAFNVRLSTDTGVAYLWYKTDVSKLLTRFGPSVSREIGGPNKRYTPELSTGLELEQAFSPRNKVSLSSDYFPSVERFSDYRVNTRASWELIVAPMWGVSLKFSLIDRFDSTPGLNRKRNDIDYSLLAMWSY